MSEINSEGSYSVVAPSGAIFHVLTEQEVKYFDERSSKYLTEHHVTNVSDIQDIDRLLIMELMCWRWGLWLSQERDYFGEGVDLDALQKSLSDYSKELRLIKKGLGIDKVTRDKERGDSVADYLENLRARAKEFGIVREEQLTRALTLFNELSALLTLRRNCDPVERAEQHVEDKDILEWIETIAIPEYEELDAYFRENSQRFWVKSL